MHEDHDIVTHYNGDIISSCHKVKITIIREALEALPFNLHQW